jgi:cell division protein ZipA
MDLRVSLLIIGSLIILAIYLISRRKLSADERRISGAITESISKHGSALWQLLRTRLQPQSKPVQEEVYTPTAPMLQPEDDLGEIIAERGATEIATEELPVIVELGAEQIAPAGEQLFVPLTIMAKAGHQLSGDSIQQATAAAGLLLSDDGIYRYEIEDTQGYRQPLLGLANILEPGTFTPEQMPQLTTPGLVLYLHLPAPIEARVAFEQLLDVGHQLAELLEAELCDETRSVLTKQTIGHLNEKVESFRFKQKMTQLQRRRP